MNNDERFNLIKEVGEEIITEEDLKSLLKEKKNPVAYDGFEPSGTNIHIAQGLLRAININKMTKAGCKFKILVARAKQGIGFAESPHPVHAVFVLAGTRDERNFHLRALAAIAQICQQRDFDRHWLRARNIEELRDIILLAERKRFGMIEEA